MAYSDNCTSFSKNIRKTTHKWLLINFKTRKAFLKKLKKEKLLKEVKFVIIIVAS